jgi:hypothetical protein
MSTDAHAGPGWEERIDAAEWDVYRRVMNQARQAGVRFAFGGAFATAVYTNELRNTKDFDFYILPEDRPAMIEAISRAGLEDYHEQLPYDRSWIYRASAGGVIVDAIWAMANARTTVDERWLGAGPEVSLHGERLRAIPIEELIWSKLYVMQRERCDWGDVFNLIDAQADQIDWSWLIQRLGEDVPLLGGALAVFSWLAPDRAETIPVWVGERGDVDLAGPPSGAEEACRRAALLDSRPWFRVNRNG